MKNTIKLEIKLAIGSSFEQIGHTVVLKLREHYNDFLHGDSIFIKDHLYKILFITGTFKSAEQAVKEVNKDLKKHLYHLINDISSNRISSGFDYEIKLEKGISEEHIEAQINTIKLILGDFKVYLKPTPFEQRILKFTEKHGDRYYILHSPDEAKKVFLQVLTERYEDNWYDWMKDYVPYYLQKVTKIPTLEEIAALGDNFNKLFKQQEEMRDLYIRIHETVTNKNFNEANYIINDLRGNEYEGFEFIIPNEIFLN